MNCKPTKNFKIIMNQLGKNYSSKIIDMELCGYRKLNDDFDIEISGINNNKKVNLDISVYVWKLNPEPVISASYPNIKSINNLLETLKVIEEKYFPSN